MPGKPGMRWSDEKREPRFDGRNRGDRPNDPDLPDPANGEAVLRCISCGVPDRESNRVYSGMWAHLRFHMDAGLCAACIAFHARHVDSSPLTELEDVA